MSKQLRKYHHMAIMYLTLTIGAGGYTVYNALPATIANNGDKTNNILNSLEANIDEDTEVLNNIHAAGPEELNIDFKSTVTQGGDIDPDTSGLFTWNTDASAEIKTEKPVQKEVPIVSTKSQAGPTLDEDPFLVKDPFKIEEPTSQKPVEDVKQPSKVDKKPQPKPTLTNSTTNTTKPVNTPSPKPVSNTKPVDIPSSKPVSDTKPTTQTTSSSTTQSSTNLNVSESDLDTLTAEGLLDKKFRIRNKEDIKVSNEMLSAAGVTAKLFVSDFYNNIPSSDLYDTVYDSDKNIIYIEIQKDVSKDGLDLLPIFDAINILDFQVFDNNASGIFDIQADTDELKLTPKSGFNGSAQLSVNGIPIVVYNNPTVEPILDEALRARITALQVDSKEDTTGGNVPGVQRPTTDFSEVTSNTHTHNHTDNEDSFFSDLNEYDYTGDLGTGDDSTYDSAENKTSVQAEAEHALSQIKTELENKKKQNNAYRPTWGLTEKDTTELKNNISDGKDIQNKPGVILNVIDITGEQIDLEKATQQAKPAAIKEHQAIKVIREEQEEKVPLSVFLGLFLILINLLLYVYYLKKFQKEYRRYLETRGLLGTVEVEDLGNFAKLDFGNMGESTEKEIISADIILSDD